jgi:polycomb protein EED
VNPVAELPQWALPELPTEHVAVPFVIHYPHFSSSEIHNNLVDW